MSNDLLQRRIDREISARKMAESLLESKSLELYEANQRLLQLNSSLEEKINQRTSLLEQSKKIYKDLVDRANEVILNIDHEGVIRFVNQACYTIGGYESDEILDRNFVNFVPEEYFDEIVQYATELLDKRENKESIEFPLKTKSGALVWLDLSINRVEDEGQTYFHLVGRDITDQKITQLQIKQIQDEIKTSEAKFRSAFENMSLGVVELDRDKLIVSAYPEFLKMSGYESADIMGKPFRDLIVNDHKLEFSIHEDEPDVMEIQFKKKDGSFLWTIVSKTIYYDENDLPRGWVYILYDISTRKELEDNLLSARHQAEKARQSEKDFLANMSHEIRTPLNSIIGMVHLLEDTELNENQANYLEALKSSAGLLKSLVSDVLDMSKIEADMMDLDPSPFCLNKMIPPILNTFRYKDDGRNVTISSDLDTRIDHCIVTDKNLLNQVIYNLIGNASKFTERGHIIARTKLLQDHEDYYDLSIEIEDTGIGISPENQKIIFDKFKQADPSTSKNYGGSGLGLTISKKIIELLGGKIEVDSALGKGSTFRIFIKLPKGSIVDEPNGNKKLDIMDEPQGGRILVVEDNNLNIKYISSLLSKWNIPFDVALNGQEGVNMAANTKYDLILMDVQMPVMDGYEATEEILSNSPLNSNTPIVALSASSLESKKQQALDTGMKGFISKPFTPDELISVISKYRASEKSLSDSTANQLQFTPPFDQDYLQENYGEDYSQLVDMFDLYLTVMEDERKNLLECIQDKDYSRAKSVTHKIKPTFTMIGLSPITGFIKQLEFLYQNEKIPEFESGLISLADQIEDTFELIRKEMESIEQYLSYQNPS